MKRFKTYFTYLGRNKLFTLVNIGGLAISLMFVILIADMVSRQLTVDRNIKDADRIYLMADEQTVSAHYQLGVRLQSRYPEIEDWTSIGDFYTMPSVPQGNNENSFVSIKYCFARKNFFEFFSFKVLKGNPSEILLSDNNIVLTRSAALRLFGTEDVIGKTITPSFNNTPYIVTGIVEDIENSIFPDDIEAFIPQENAKYPNWSADIEDTRMSNAGSATLFFKFAKGVNPNNKADDVLSYLKEFFWRYERGSSKVVTFIPMRDFYFSKYQSWQDLRQYDFTQVLIFLATGIIILLMAVFNYASMSIAQTSYRAKEMSTRRLLGSSRSEIFWRMITESFMLTVVSFVIGFILAKAAEPVAADLLGTKIDIVGDLNWITIICYAAFITILSLMAGMPAASILSSYNPLDVVKGTFRRKTKASYMRWLNLVQSGLTIALLACSIFLYTRVHDILNAPLGYEYGNVIIYPSTGYQLNVFFKGEAMKLPFVKNVSYTMGTPADGGNNNTMFLQTKNGTEEFSFQSFIADSAFLKIFHIQITEDRKLTSPNAFFISENTMKMLKDLGLNTNRITGVSNSGWTIDVAGQFKDFKIRSLLSNDIHPLKMQILPSDSIKYPWSICVEVDDSNRAEAKQQLDEIFSKMIDGMPFDSTWYDDFIKSYYQNVMKINKLLVIFTCVAFIISLLGLTAMSIYFISQRKRDMAIRKVFGATSGDEMKRMLRFSFISILAGTIVAIPLIWIGVDKISQIVNYGRDFQWWMGVLAFVATALISLVSVWLISLKAVNENPVNNIKTE